MMVGTCPRTPNGTSKGHQKDINNNDNNIIFNLLLNKYKQNFPSSFREKIKIIAEIQNSDDYMKLTEQEQMELFYKLMSLRRSDL